MDYAWEDKGTLEDALVLVCYSIVDCSRVVERMTSDCDSRRAVDR